jgi:hypothetical protein
VLPENVNAIGWPNHTDGFIRMFGHPAFETIKCRDQRDHLGRTSSSFHLQWRDNSNLLLISSVQNCTLYGASTYRYWFSGPFSYGRFPAPAKKAIRGQRSATNRKLVRADMAGKGSPANAAISARLHEFSINHGGTPEENQLIQDGLSGLSVLRREVVAWRSKAAG